VLVITGDVSLTGNNDRIELKSGSSLVMYVQGANAKIAGQGVINETGDASKFLYMGLPSNTSLSFSGNANFIGAIYAPNAAFTLGGGGNDIKDFSGAGVVSSVKMNGHFKFHYDENLGRTLRNPSFVITSWNEI
jgi:choice-of-anchor A domain-containing protein